ncbi:hypothetical protein [Labilithrix luteola]|uniref:hypothetical protein n=1 Tax=Labilithrix luteola TaxID=1391654 RepID=UPI001F0B31D1|nr:hypothetical protein [Labilithrix luteola]
MKLADGKVPARGATTELEDALFTDVKNILGMVRQAWLDLEPHRAMEATFALASAGNLYVDRAAPWATVKQDPARAHTQLNVLLELLSALSIAIWPAMPNKSDEMRAKLGLPSLRVRLVKTAEKVPKKDKLLRLTVDLGEESPRTIVAGLALTFKEPEVLVGRRVVVVANLAPRDFGSADFGKGKEKLVSHGMLLASGPSEDLRLASIADHAPAGARLK